MCGYSRCGFSYRIMMLEIHSKDQFEHRFRASFKPWEVELAYGWHHFDSCYGSWTHVDIKPITLFTSVLSNWSQLLCLIFMQEISHTEKEFVRAPCYTLYSLHTLHLTPTLDTAHSAAYTRQISLHVTLYTPHCIVDTWHWVVVSTNLRMTLVILNLGAAKTRTCSEPIFISLNLWAWCLECLARAGTTHRAAMKVPWCQGLITDVTRGCLQCSAKKHSNCLEATAKRWNWSI